MGLRENLKKCGAAITTLATAATLHQYIKSMKDQNLEDKLKDISRKSADNDRIIENMEINNKLTKAQLEREAARLENSFDKINVLKKKMEDIASSSTEGNDENTKIQSDLINDITTELDKATNHLSDAISILKKKYWEPSDVDNFFDFVRGLYESWNVILSQLTQFQIGALAHLLSSILILMCLSSVIAIIYSEYLLTYLKIEEKYPRIGRFIRIRRKFQQYYLFLNLTLIIITLLALIYANILALSI